MDNAKPWYESWTVWLNALTLTSLVLALPEVVAIIPAAWVPAIAAVNAVANLAVRIYKTDQPVAH